MRRSSVAFGMWLALLAAPATSMAAEPEQSEGLLTEQPVSADSSPDEQTPDGSGKRGKVMDISCRDQHDLPGSWLDRTHSYLTQHLCEPAAWFDGFFGDDRALEETPVGTFFRLRNELRWDEEEGVDNRLRLAANIELPRASKKLRLILTRDEDVTGEFQPNLPEEDTNSETRIGLRYNLSDRLLSRLDVDANVKLKWGAPNPLLRARYRHLKPLTERTFARFTQTAFWAGDEGFGTTSRADWEWYRRSDRQLRVTAQGTWSEESDGIDWRSGITHFRQLDERSAIMGQIGAFGWTDPEFKTEEYFVNVRYRRSFVRSWLFYELRPEHAWVIDDRSQNRRGDWRFILTFEAQFENKSARADRIRRIEERRAKRAERHADQQPEEQPDTAPEA